MASAPKINILKYEDDDKHIIDPILLDVDDSQETGMYMVNGIQLKPTNKNLQFSVLAWLGS